MLLRNFGGRLWQNYAIIKMNSPRISLRKCRLQRPQTLPSCATRIYTTPEKIILRENSCVPLITQNCRNGPLGGQNRQSPIASVHRTQSTLASHSAVPLGTNAAPMNANRATRIAAQRTQGPRGQNSVFWEGI